MIVVYLLSSNAIHYNPVGLWDTVPPQTPIGIFAKSERARQYAHDEFGIPDDWITQENGEQHISVLSQHKQYTICKVVIDSEIKGKAAWV